MLEATIIGRIGKDAEVKTFGEEKFASFSVASTSKSNDQKKTTWVEVLDKLNAGLLPYLKKGTQVFVRGTLSCKAYSKQDGSIGASMRINAKYLELLGGSAQQEGAAAPQQPAEQPMQKQYKEEQDLPF